MKRGGKQSVGKVKTIAVGASRRGSSTDSIMAVSPLWREMSQVLSISGLPLPALYEQLDLISRRTLPKLLIVAGLPKKFLLRVRYELFSDDAAS